MEIDINSLDLYSGETDVDETRLRAELAEWLPHSGDQLFVETPTAARVDCLGYSGPGVPRRAVGRFNLYQSAFLEAGDRIVKSCEGYPIDDTMIYPIMFLYRHHLELSLKGVIYSCRTSLSDLTPDEVERKKAKLVDMHGLQRLWELLNSIYPQCNDWAAADDPNAPEAFKNLIVEFDDHDPNGQAARYSEFRDGSQTLIKLRSVDLQILKSSVHKMSQYLAAILEDMYQRDEWRSEVESWSGQS
jgi:hypothetical protein